MATNQNTTAITAKLTYANFSSRSNPAFTKQTFPVVVKAFNRSFLQIKKDFPASQTKEVKNAQVPAKSYRLLDFSEKAAATALQACETECDADQVVKLFNLSFKALSMADFAYIDMDVRQFHYTINDDARAFLGLSQNKLLINKDETRIADIVKQSISAAIILAGREGVRLASSTILDGLIKAIGYKIKSEEFGYIISSNITNALDDIKKLLLSR